MNIEAQKLWLIEQLLQVEDRDLLEYLKNAFLGYSTQLQPMTWQELQTKIDQSEQDYANGRTYTTEQLDEEMKNW